jgi:hypothetical protein
MSFVASGSSFRGAAFEVRGGRAKGQKSQLRATKSPRRRDPLFRRIPLMMLSWLEWLSPLADRWDEPDTAPARGRPAFGLTDRGPWPAPPRPSSTAPLRFVAISATSRVLCGAPWAVNYVRGSGAGPSRRRRRRSPAVLACRPTRESGPGRGANAAAGTVVMPMARARGISRVLPSVLKGAVCRVLC